MNTKHTKQKCKVCDLEFETSIAVLIHVAEKHKGRIDQPIQDREKIEDAEPEELQFEDDKFICSHCKKIVPNEDTFDMHKDEGMKMCHFAPWLLNMARVGPQ